MQSHSNNIAHKKGRGKELMLVFGKLISSCLLVHMLSHVVPVHFLYKPFGI